MRDRHGRPITYLHDDAHFVLVTFGSDGIPDRPDYETLLGLADPKAKRRNCLRPTLDTVIVDGHMWQGCSE